MYQHNHNTKFFPCVIFHLSLFAFSSFLGDTLALIGLSQEVYVGLTQHPLYPVVLAVQLLQGRRFVLLQDCDALVSGEHLVLHPLLHFSVTANQRGELHSSCFIQIREKVTSSTIGLVLHAIS